MNLVTKISPKPYAFKPPMSPRIFVPTASSLLTGLVAYYGLNEGSGSTINDSSVNGYGGTTTGSPTWIAGKVGSNALTFAAGTDGVSITNAAPFDFGNSSTYSLSCWFKYSSGTAIECLLGKTATTGNLPGYDIALDKTNARLRFDIIGSDGSAIQMLSAINSAPADGAWRHVAVTYNGNGLNSGMVFYLNGSSTGTAGGTITASSNNAIAFKIASTSGLTNLTGSIDEVGIWSKVLTVGEVSTLYNSGTGIAYPFS